MPISVTLNNKLILVGCLIGMLQGCTTRTITDNKINNVIKNEDGFQLVVGRKWLRITEGADWDKETVIKQDSEYYQVPLDFSKPEIHLEPLLVNNKYADAMYHPKINALTPYETEFEQPNGVKANPELFVLPKNYNRVGWDRKLFGREGYAYSVEYGDRTTMVHNLFFGEKCTFSIEKDLFYAELFASNDGENIGLVEKNEDTTLWRISIFNGCKKVFSKEIKNQELDVTNFDGFDANNGAIWFVLRNQDSRKIFNSNFELIFSVPEKEFESNSYSNYDLPMHRPIFDSAAKKLYWFSNGGSGGNDDPNLQLVLTEYDLVAKTKRSVLLKLGNPLH